MSLLASEPTAARFLPALRRPQLGAGALAVPALVLLVALFAVPLGLMLVQSFDVDGALSLANYANFLGEAYGWEVIGNTLSVALRVTLICLAIGYPIALLLVRLKGWLLGLALAALVLPMSLNVIVKAFAWQVLLRREGIVNKLLIAAGWIDSPLRILFTETALILGAVNIFIPFMVLPIYSVARQIDPRVLEAAKTLGAGPVYRMAHVTVPLTLPGIVAGVAFVLSLCISMYVIPVLLIGDRFQTLSTQTARAFLTFANHALGATTASILLVIGCLVVFASGWLVHNLGGRR
jgi:putative spermidine/putrescine transport system permease protein